ncbi:MULTISPECIES: hypothetical protein [Psychrobacter]|uniref:hypothetical protein n=1 Tax=Psychrobacter TaxID=497 RepID=UPI00146B82D0|nr:MULTISPECIES: hypothetical protein [Psychrobacter]
MDNQQDLHDKIENLVTSIAKVIPALQNLIEDADTTISTRLNQSLDSVDETVGDVKDVIGQLNSSADTANQSLKDYPDKVLKQLQSAAMVFAETKMPDRYDDKVKALIKETKTQVSAAIDVLVDDKKDNLAQQIVALKQVTDKLAEKADKLTTFIDRYQDGHDQIIQDIEDFEAASAKRVADSHHEALKKLEKLQQVIENMSIKKIAAMFGAGILVMVLSFIALTFWYIPSYNEISALKREKQELEEGIVELKTGWSRALNDAKKNQLVVVCKANIDNPKAIGLCVRADTRYAFRDGRGLMYYQINVE